LFQDISIEELLLLQQKKEITLIDVRSPSEFLDATIPGSLNIPVFNDEQRAEIGTIYTQVNSQSAKDRGLEIMSAKLPDFVREFGKIEGSKAVFCWRGGMRSKTTATVLSLMDIHVYRLSGGVRAYRRWVVESLSNIQFRPEAIVIQGLTGTGKTAILKRLQEDGYPVMDLEGMANHRGSIFGDIGLRSHNQKTFDALLLRQITELQSARYVLIEAESKRIGKVVLPEFIVEKKERGIVLTIEMPMSERVHQIITDYEPHKHKDECMKAFRIIKDRIHIPIAKEIDTALQSDDYNTAVSLLLEYYYDPRYDHTFQQYDSNDTIDISANNVEEAVTLIKKYLDQRESNLT
jgi:tRNA 2-selenouridine synthase